MALVRNSLSYIMQKLTLSQSQQTLTTSTPATQIRNNLRLIPFVMLALVEKVRGKTLYATDTAENTTVELNFDEKLLPDLEHYLNAMVNFVISQKSNLNFTQGPTIPCEDENYNIGPSISISIETGKQLTAQLMGELNNAFGVVCEEYFSDHPHDSSDSSHEHSMTDGTSLKSLLGIGIPLAVLSVGAAWYFRRLMGKAPSAAPTLESASFTLSISPEVDSATPGSTVTKGTETTPLLIASAPEVEEPSASEALRNSPTPRRW